MSSISPLIDCGVHSVDVMCRMTRSKPIRVSGIGARRTDDLPVGTIHFAVVISSRGGGGVGE